MTFFDPAGVSNVYRFREFVLDPGKRTLSRADSAISLTPKAFDVLLFLVRNPNRLVTKEELLHAVWGDAFVEEGNLTQYISHLRKALGDNSEDSRLIVTIARKGYQFTVDVTVAGAAEAAKQLAVQLPTAEGLRATTQPAARSPVHRAVPKEEERGRRVAVVGASALILVVVGYIKQVPKRMLRDISPIGEMSPVKTESSYEESTAQDWATNC